MSGGRRYLLVGGDSLVGRGVVAALERRGHPALATTRRRDTVGPSRLFFDFEDEASFRVPPGIDHVLVVAAATNYERCETDPLARRINVEMIPRAVGCFLEQKLFVTFISTNSVFGGQRPWPREDAPHAPDIAYAEQKSLAEAAIRRAAEQSGFVDRLNLVRLTKILDRETRPIPGWLDAWRNSKAARPFSDLIFAPTSVRFVGEALVTLAERPVPGSFHLSGAENVSYVEFAHALAARLQVAPELVAPTTAVEMGVNIPFKPKYSGLDMTRAKDLFGLRPQSLAEVVDDLFADVSR